jgi:hypothetical protein
MTETQIARMEARAMEQRWPTKPEYRDALIKRNVKIILNPNSSERAVAAASKVIIAAEAQNQADEHKVIDVRVITRNDDLDGIAADLGIEVGVIEAVQREADLGIDGTEAEGQPQPNYRT